MNTLKQHVCAVALFLFLSLPFGHIRADLFGGDIPLLIQLIANSIKQLTELRGILKQGDVIQHESSKAYTSQIEASKMTARGIGALLQSLAQMQRNQAMAIKLQSQDLAEKNAQEKIQTEQYIATKDAISQALSSSQMKTRLVTLK